MLVGLVIVGGLMYQALRATTLQPFIYFQF
jgi:hypothetical protein